ncbi:hypothetical protein EAE99_006831 [Botrytis elliptica]|nr:hypothetical protein EAE99_006831 [Botrytis elliptica]
MSDQRPRGHVNRRENVLYNAVPVTEPSQRRPSWLKKASEYTISSHSISYHHPCKHQSQYPTTPATNQPNHDSHVTQLSIKLSSVSVSRSSTTRHVAGAAASLPYHAQINAIHHCSTQNTQNQSYWDHGLEDQMTR